MAGSSPANRQRSCAAIVMTRADPAIRVPGAPAPPPRHPRRGWQWLWWVPLVLLVAGAWALLLVGDSLR